MAAKTITTNTAPTVNMALVRTYADLVTARRRTIDSLPEAYKEAVQEYLKGQA